MFVVEYCTRNVCFSLKNHGVKRKICQIPCERSRGSVDKRQKDWLSQVGQRGTRGIRLRFNEHANDRGSSGVQRGPTFVFTCFPRVSFTRHCKTVRGRNSFPFWSTCTPYPGPVLFDVVSRSFTYVNQLVFWYVYTLLPITVTDCFRVLERYSHLVRCPEVLN